MHHYIEFSPVRECVRVCFFAFGSRLHKVMKMRIALNVIILLYMTIFFAIHTVFILKEHIMFSRTMDYLSHVVRI